MYWTYLGVAPTRSHDPITHITTVTPRETFKSTTFLTVDLAGNPVQPRPTVTVTSIVSANGPNNKRHEHSLSWSQNPAGFANSTAFVGTITAPGTAVSHKPTATGSHGGKPVDWKASLSKFWSGHHKHERSTVTVTRRTTVTESICSTSAVPMVSAKPDSEPTNTRPDTAAVSDVSMASSSLVTGAESPQIAQSIQMPGPVVFVSTHTEWSTTWHFVTTTVDTEVTVSTSNPAGENGDAPGNPNVDDQPQAPIDQTYGVTTAVPMTTSIPSAASVVEPNVQSVSVSKPTTSCSKSSTTTLPEVHFSNPPITIQTTLPTAGLGTAPFNTLQPSEPTSHPASTIPVIPSLPYGHPPSLSGSPNYHNHTNTLSHGTKPTHHATAAPASLTNPHLHTRRPTSTSTHSKHPQCTTTFPHAPTRACTTTHYASTTTFASKLSRLRWRAGKSPAGLQRESRKQLPRKSQVNTEVPY